MSYSVTFLCTGCGLRVPLHREAEVIDHRSETGHTRIIALSIDRAHDRANYKANRRARAAAAKAEALTPEHVPAAAANQDLEQRLTAMFGGAR